MDTIRTILIIAAAIVVALILWWIIAFVTSVLFTVFKFALLLVVLYMAFLFARSEIRRRRTREA